MVEKRECRDWMSLSVTLRLGDEVVVVGMVAVGVVVYVWATKRSIGGICFFLSLDVGFRGV